MSEEKAKIVVGATGASGIPILIQCLKLIREAEGFSSALIMSDASIKTLKYETDFAEEDIYALADEYYDPEDIGAGPASGTWKSIGMLIVPCSMKTLAGVHSGYADSLLLRAANVCLKEKRPLVLAARETPMSPIDLRNAYELSLLPNVHIIPPMIEFYSKPQSIDEMVYHISSKLLAPFGLEAPEFRRWSGLTKS